MSRSSNYFSPPKSNVETIFMRASTSAAKYVADSSRDNSSQLDESLSDVIKFLGSVDQTVRLSLKSHSVSELLAYSPIVLSSTTTSAVTRSRFHRILFNIGLHNTRIRKYMSKDLELCSPVFVGLKASLKDQLGPQNMIDILRLLQVLTYDKSVTLGVWTNELISFLMGEVVRKPEQEWMPYCIAILCNLTSRSKSVCNRIMKSTSFKPFSRRVTDLLCSDSRIVVVSSLVLLGYLDEKLRDLVFCTKNMHETFQCVFNVLILGDGDCMITRHIAADLLRRLVVSDVPTIASVPVLATTAAELVNYDVFDTFIQGTAGLLVTLDPKLEESWKVYDLLLSFCTLQVLRARVCSAIIRCPPTQQRLTTPILAIASTAALTVEECIEPEVPLRAIRLLALLVREIVDTHEKIGPFLPKEQVVPLIISCVNTTVDPSEENAVYSSTRVQLGLRLAEACCQDEDIRSDLFDSITAQACHKISEFQFVNNPVVYHLSKAPLQRSASLPEWSLSGVGSVLELTRLLAVLKDHSKMHKDQYWRLLKDERLIPFLAFAMSSGDHEMAFYALNTFKHCSQVHVFPTQLLAEMVASCGKELRLAKAPPPTGLVNGSMSLNTSMEATKPSLETTQEQEAIRIPKSPESSKALDELLRKVSIGMEIKDVKMSEIMTAYERKISMLQNQAQDLEELIKAKDQALSHSEKLRTQYRTENACGYTTDKEMSQVRVLMQKCEQLREENDKVTALYEETRKTLEDKTQFLRDELSRARQERDRLSQEMEEERALVIAARTTADDLKKKLEVASATALERQNAIINLNREKITQTNELSKFKSDLDSLKKLKDKEMEKMGSDIAQQVMRIERLMKENSSIQRRNEELGLEVAACREEVKQAESALLKRNGDVAALNSEKNKLEAKLHSKERELGSVLNEAQSLRDTVAARDTELEKMRRMREAMLNLAGNF